MSRVLVTGASGFVGNTLCPMLAGRGYIVRAALRPGRTPPPDAAENVLIDSVDGRTDWTTALAGVEWVIHLAARAHVLNDTAGPERLYTEINTEGTRHLAEAAARLGARRFIFLSTVKVNGEESPGRPYSADDEPQPQDAYGRSKQLAEGSLWDAASRSRMQVAVVRSPLVYGAGVRANFLRLLQWVDRERVLPLGAIRNRRSLVSAWSLCDLLIHLLSHPAASGRTWMVSDGEDLSTPELVQRLARALGRRTRLVPVPVAVLRLAGAFLGKGVEVRRLCGSLVVDISPARTLLGWSPPLSMDEALARTVSWYQSHGRPPA